MIHLTEPHGGVLKELYLSVEDAAPFKAQAQEYPSWDLTPRQLCDLELLLNGGCSPLDGFLNRADYQRVVENMRLADGTLWPMPITLDVSEEFAGQLDRGTRVALRDPEGVLIAVLEVGDVWRPDRLHEARRIFGDADERHPGVFHLLHRTGPVYVGGRLYGIEPPTHYDFPQLRGSPRELRASFAQTGLAARSWPSRPATPAPRPSGTDLPRRAQAEANLLIHPVVGMTKPGDVDHFTRVRCYEAVLDQYPPDHGLSLLNLAMRMAGPREAVWHGIIRKNHGCTHFIVGRDHAGPGKNSQGKDFYDPYAAQNCSPSTQARSASNGRFQAHGLCAGKGPVLSRRTRSPKARPC
jgi:sulfate adenylyltransferase